MRRISMGLLLVYIGAFTTVSWGVTFGELAEPGRSSIAGIGSIESTIQSRVSRSKSPLTIARRRQAQNLARQKSQKKKLSLAHILSDEATTVKGSQMQKSPENEPKTSLPGQFVSAEYFPLQPGLTREYLMNGSRISTIKVLPERATVRGVETSIVVNEKTGASVCYTSDQNGILIHRQLFPNIFIQGLNTEVDILVTFIPPIRLADGLVEIGQTAYSIGIAQYTLLSQGKVFDLDYSATYTVQSTKEITVPAGAFDTLVFRGEMSISGDHESDVFYLSKGTGLVKGVVKSADQKKIAEFSLTNSVYR